MNEDKSLDVLGIKPVAKALEKATDKTIDGLSSFFGAICMPAAEEFGLLLRDKMAVFRKRNLEAIGEKSQKKIKQQKIKVSGQANPVLIREVLEEACGAKMKVFNQCGLVCLLLPPATQQSQMTLWFTPIF